MDDIVDNIVDDTQIFVDQAVDDVDEDTLI